MIQHILTQPVEYIPQPRPNEIDPTSMALGRLADRAATEGRLFYHQQSHDPRFAYELFRRALVERSEEAWEHIYMQYYPLVEHWVRRTGAYTCAGESSEYFVSAAFLRFWKAISPERFRSFPTLASLLNYLRRCASCVVIDSARAASYADLLPEEYITRGNHPQSCAAEEATARVDRGEFWRAIDGLLQDERERTVVHGSFLLGMKPSEIFAARPELYAGVEEVYAIKRTVLARLRRNNELRQLYEE